MKICNNCGTTSEFIEGICKCCSSKKITDLHVTTNEWFKLTKSQKDNLIKNQLSLSDDEYNLIQEAWDNNRKNIEPNPKPINTYSSNAIKCPYCNATDVSKISTAGRVVSVGLFGLGSSKIGKQWHCKKCGSDF